MIQKKYIQEIDKLRQQKSLIEQNNELFANSLCLLIVGEKNMNLYLRSLGQDANTVHTYICGLRKFINNYAQAIKTDFSKKNINIDLFKIK